MNLVFIGSVNGLLHVCCQAIYFRVLTYCLWYDHKQASVRFESKYSCFSAEMHLKITFPRSWQFYSGSNLFIILHIQQFLRAIFGHTHMSSLFKRKQHCKVCPRVLLRIDFSSWLPSTAVTTADKTLPGNTSLNLTHWPLGNLNEILDM